MAFNFWDWEKNNELNCIFAGQLKSVGRFKKNVFVFQLKNNTVVHSWAYVDLMNGMHGIPFKTPLKIVYNGMDKMPNAPHRKFKSFTIEAIEKEDL